MCIPTPNFGTSIAFSNPENTCNYIMGAKFNRDLLKMSNFGTKIATPPTIFVARGVKLGSYVHCLSKCVVYNFDLGP